MISSAHTERGISSRPACVSLPVKPAVVPAPLGSALPAPPSFAGGEPSPPRDEIASPISKYFLPNHFARGRGAGTDSLYNIFSRIISVLRHCLGGFHVIYIITVGYNEIRYNF